MVTKSGLYIQNAMVLCLDQEDRHYRQADILVEGGRIVALAEDLSHQAREYHRRIDANSMLAMPGLINCHFHSPGSFLKGQLENLPLELFMLYEVPAIAETGDMWRYSYLCTQLAAFEMLQRGITSVHDDAYHIPRVTHDSIDAIMQAYEDAGIRATVAIDQPNLIEYEKYPFLLELLPDELVEAMNQTPRQSAAELLSQYQYLIDRWHRAAEGRLNAAVSCSAPQRVSEEYIRGLSALSEQYNLPFNMHILETKLQRVLGDEKYGKSLVQLIHDLGVLNERCQIIHAIWIDDQDIRMLAESGCVVAHNPVCNLRLGSGVMPYQQLREAGVPIAIGTDELCSDDSANLWCAGKTAGLIHTLSNKDPETWPKADDILLSLTRQGARSMAKAGELGELKEGALADIILLDLDTWAFTPLNDLKRQLVYCEDGSSVRYTIVNGQVIYDNGEFPQHDVRALRAEIRGLGQQILDVQQATIEHVKKLWPYYEKMYWLAHDRQTRLHRRLLPDD